MVEPLTIVGTGLAILGSKDLLNKLLGPTADYLGGQTAGLVEKCNINLDRVFAAATRKLGKRLEKAGSVSPRVLRHVVEDGRFCEDELVAEYYGGLLASSRTVDGKDDSGIPHLARVKAMSVYQIRLHFFIYYSMFRVFKGTTKNVADFTHRSDLKIFIPFSALLPSFGLAKPSDLNGVFAHSIYGLHAQGLVHYFTYGPAEHFQKEYKGIKEPGFWIEPTFLGLELFLWAIGLESPDGNQFFHYAIDLEKPPIPVPAKARVLAQLKADG